MKTYQVTKATPTSNSVVEELNASVLTATFPDTTGVKEGHLFFSTGAGYQIVHPSNCGPINGTFCKSIMLKF